jgi:tetratricopeptide (TPR) repeat protein
MTENGGAPPGVNGGATPGVKGAATPGVKGGAYLGKADALALLIALLTAAVYFQVKDFDFLPYDDNVYVTANRLVAGGLSAEAALSVFKPASFHLWHPVTMLSHMLDVRIFGLRPAGHHLINVLLHAAAAALLLHALIAVKIPLWQGAFVAAAFALHPMHVESVAWVSERKDVLSALFCFLTIYLYARYAKKPSAVTYLPVAASFALGLMSKPMLVTLPILLLALDFWPMGRFCAAPASCEKPFARAGVIALVAEKIPLLALSAADSFIAYIAMKKSTTTIPLDTLPLDTRVLNALHSYASYLFKAFAPEGMSVLHPLYMHQPRVEAAAALLLLTAITAACIAMRKRAPYLVTGWSWFVVSLVPVIGIVQTGDQGMSDRYTYIPYVGLFIAAAAGMPRILDHLWPRRAKTLAAAAAVMSLIVFTSITARQISFWKDGPTLFKRAVLVHGDYFMGYHYLGLAQMTTGRFEDAAVSIRKCIDLHRDGEVLEKRGYMAEAYNNLGMTLSILGRHDEAISAFSEGMAKHPDFAPLAEGLKKAKAIRDEVLKAAEGAP